MAWRNQGLVAPTQYRIICDLAAAAKDRGTLPTRARVAPSVWACLAMDYFVPTCKCANCTAAVGSTIRIGGVVVEIDRYVCDGCVMYDYDDGDSLMAEGYAFQSL